MIDPHARPPERQAALMSVVPRFRLAFLFRGRMRRRLLERPVIRHFLVPVLQLRQVGRPRLRVQLIEQTVVAVVLFGLVDPAVMVVQIAEYDRVGRASGLARGYDLAVCDRPSVLLRLDTRRRYALGAVGALFHHTAAAN